MTIVTLIGKDNIELSGELKSLKPQDQAFIKLKCGLEDINPGVYEVKFTNSKFNFKAILTNIICGKDYILVCLST